MPKHLSADPSHRVVSSTERLAARAWRRHTYGLGSGPGGWFDLVEAFVSETRPRDPERTAAALLLALDNCRSWDQLVEGGWIQLVSVHVYTYFEGGGMGALRALQVSDRLIQWMERSGLLHEWDAACMRHHIDVQRACCGGRMRGVPEAWDLCTRLQPWDRVVKRFVANVPQDHSPHVVEGMVQLLAAATRLRGTEVVRIGALDPYDLWEPALEDLGDAGPGRGEEEPFVRAVARVGASFCRWLAAEERLEPRRARRVEQQLLRLAALPGPGSPPLGQG